MNGFEGPFEFDIDDEGHRIEWEQLDGAVRDELTKNNTYSRETSSIYEVRVAVLAHPQHVQKHHDWKKIKRVFVESRVGSPRMAILAISPTTKHWSETANAEMDFLKFLAGERLFDSKQFKLKPAFAVKNFARSDRFAVLSFFSRKVAQWVFSEGWHDLGFRLALVVVVPNDLDSNARKLVFSVKPTYKETKFIQGASVWDKDVALPLR